MTVGLPIAGSNGGFFTVSGDGTVIFDPAGAFADLGPNEFRDTGVAVTVSDAVGATATATVIARVRANASANPAPVTVAPLPDKAVTSGVPVVPFSVSGAFGDPGDVLAYSAAGLPAGLSIDAASGIVSGTPTAGPGTAFVLVTATDTAGETAVAGFSITIDAALSAPVLLTSPAIAGTAAVGATLTTVPGHWAGRPVPSISHRWRRDGAPIAGATGPSYVVASADAGTSLTLQETAANSEGSATAVSVAVNVSGSGAFLPPVAAGALPDQSYTEGVAITQFDTSADFTGVGLTYALAPGSPALPAGLSLAPGTGIISGTPTVTVTAASIVIRATNAAGFADSGFSLTVSSAINANFTSVNADGWTATYPSPPAVVSPGIDNALVTPEAFTVTRSGFDATGSATTFDEDLTVMARLRLAYPNQTSLTTDQVTLSDFVYAGDTVSGATNNSTRTAPKPIAMWLHRDLEVSSGPSFTARLAVAHHHARSGRPVAAVKFIATDGTNTVETVVSSMTKVSYTASGLSVPCFEATLDLGTLAPGQLVTIDAVIYPWIGPSFKISTDASAYPSHNLTVLKAWNGPLTPVYAYVNAATGNDTTGVASTNLATAAASPYATIRAAILDAQAANTDFTGTAANCIIRLTDDAEHAKGNWRSGIVDGPLPLIIENDPANVGTAVLNDSGSELINNSLVVRDITLKATANNAIMFDSAASGVDFSHLLVLERCIFDANAFTPWAAWVWRTGRTVLIDCSGTMPNLAGNFGGVQKMMIGIGSEGVFGGSTFHAVGCKHLGDATFGDGIHGTGDIPLVEGGFLGWSFLNNASNGTEVVGFTKQINDRGLAIVGNVIEQSGGTSNDAYGVSHDGVTVTAENVVAMQNTIVGARSNFMYQDSGTLTVTKDGVDRFSVHWQGNTKTDVFGTNGNLTGNWPVVFRVGHRGLALLTGDAGDNPHVVGAWSGEIGELDGVIGTSSVPVNADWTNDASSVAADGSGLGNGDYTPGPSTALPTVPAGLAPYPYDQTGVTIADDGSARVGALQP